MRWMGQDISVVEDKVTYWPLCICPQAWVQRGCARTSSDPNHWLVSVSQPGGSEVNSHTDFYITNRIVIVWIGSIVSSKTWSWFDTAVSHQLGSPCDWWLLSCCLGSNITRTATTPGHQVIAPPLPWIDWSGHRRNVTTQPITKNTRVFIDFCVYIVFSFFLLTNVSPFSSVYHIAQTWPLLEHATL